MESTPLTRLLCSSDIPQAMRLTESAGWNQTEQDWMRLLALAPDSCFCIECDGVVASTTTAVGYGHALAWVGMVLTAPEYRGRGFARQLLTRVLEFLDARSVVRIKLDATDMGIRLYRSVGFIDECSAERWVRRPGGSMPAPALDPGFDLALDREIFGADRSLLLHYLARDGAVQVPKAGFAMCRPGRVAEYFGPCITGSASAARRFVEWFLSSHGNQQTYWDLLPENIEAVRLATEFGFAPARRLTRMSRSRDQGNAPVDSSQVVAIAGFEYG